MGSIQLTLEVASQTPLRRFGVTCLVLALLTTGWNAIFIHGIQLGDALLAAAAIFILFDTLATGRFRRVRLGPGMRWGALLIAISGILATTFPPPATYMVNRYNPITFYTLSQFGGGGNLSQLVKFEIALVVLPVLVLMTAPTVKETRRLAHAWLLGAVINALVAISDRYAHTAISTHLLGFVDISGRQAGLAQQPNHLALALTMAIPLAVTWKYLFLPRSTRLVATVLLMFGLYLSGSRGGLVAGALAALATLYMTHRTRRLSSWLAGAGLIFLAVDAQQLIGLVAGRVGGGTVSSDLTRAALRHQAVLDFLHSPIYGIGYEVINDAHEVHLQILAAGGLIAFTGFVIYMVSAFRTAILARRLDNRHGSALLISLMTWSLLMFVENQLTDRYLFIPIVLAVAMTSSRAPSIDGTVGREYAAASSARSSVRPRRLVS